MEKARNPVIGSAVYHPAAVPIALLAGGALNGFAVRISESLHLHGLASPLLGLSPFDVIIMGVAIWLVATGLRTEASAGVLGLAEILAGLGLLLPSSAVSWAVLGSYAGYKALRSKDAARAGFLLVASLAIASLWASIGMKVFALPVTSMEAGIVAWILSLLKPGVVVAGNVVGVAGDHLLVVMAACSTLDGVGKAIVGLAAVLCFLGAFAWRAFLHAALLLAFFYMLANMARLVAMAWSKPAYEMAHGPLGANVFDMAVTLAIFALAMWKDQR